MAEVSYRFEDESLLVKQNLTILIEVSGDEHHAGNKIDDDYPVIYIIFNLL